MIPSPRILVDGALEAMDAVGEDPKKRSMILCHSSGSTCSARSIEPFTSAKRTVTCLRSPSRADFDVQDLLGQVLGRIGARVACGRRDAGGRSGTSLCPRPHENVALQASDALDLHQLLAQLGERLRVERELPSERAQGYAAMALQEVARPLDRLEEAHLASFLKRARDSRRMSRRTRLAEETLCLCEIGTPSHLVSAPAGPLGADLGQVGMERQRAHLRDERLGAPSSGSTASSWPRATSARASATTFSSSWIFEPCSCARAMARSAVSFARSGSPIST